MILAIVLLVLGADAEFARYPAEPRPTGKAAAPRLTGKAGRFRTVLREEFARPANFNGHYRVARWGCGTNCIEWAIVDLRSGKVWMAPKPVLSCGGAASTVSDWFDARVTSSLLYVHSCAADRGLVFDTRHVYRHRKGKLRLLRVETLLPL
jgi:hypothetical protein